MLEKLSSQEKAVLKALIKGIPLVPEPFKIIAEELSLTEEKVLSTIQTLLEKKTIRRLGATIRHNKAGYSANALVAWRVPEERVEEVGTLLSQNPFVSHCYLRPPLPDWNYNVYTMFHAKDKQSLLELIKAAAKEINIDEYEVLFTEREIVRKHANYQL